MPRESPRHIPQEAAATRNEIDKAIEALTPAQLLRLRKFAGWRIRYLRRAGHGREAQELLDEALRSTLEGAEGGDRGRRWNKAVDFVRHLTQAMRSISDHWKTQFDQSEAHLESELITVTEEGEELRPLDTVASDDPSPERVLEAKQELAEILARFQDDTVASIVLEGWAEGRSGPEIMELGITKNEYNAAVARIRYGLRERKR